MKHKPDVLNNLVLKFRRWAEVDLEKKPKIVNVAKRCKQYNQQSSTCAKDDFSSIHW